jgi:hypothetical protein
MRTLSTLLTILAVTSFASGFALAANTKVAASYPTCSCHFGYGNVCIAAASCDVNGGRCLETCSAPDYRSLGNR